MSENLLRKSSSTIRQFSATWSGECVESYLDQSNTLEAQVSRQVFSNKCALTPTVEDTLHIAASVVAYRPSSKFLQEEASVSIVALLSPLTDVQTCSVILEALVRALRDFLWVAHT